MENAGTKRVTVSLLKEFKKNEDIQLSVLSPGYSLKSGKTVPDKILGHLKRFFWVHIQLPWLCVLKKTDVLFSPEFNTPLFTFCKRVVIAHDAHTRAQRQYVSKAWFYFYYMPFIELPIRFADVVFTVSNFSKNELSKLMGINQEKIVVAYNSVDELFNQNTLNEQQQLPAGLKEKEYLMFIGTFESRKNVDRLLEAFALIKNKNSEALADLKLAISGNPSKSKYSDRSNDIVQLIDNLGLKDDIIFCGFIADNDLPLVYSNAILIAFPSLYEGFGLPILEAFSCSVPVLISNIEALTEVADHAALTCDPNDVKDIAEKLESLIFNQKLRDELVIRGTERLNDFSWKRTSDLMIEKIKELVR
nr:glycosyltransferase family 1 protein [Hufsiella arboris]